MDKTYFIKRKGYKCNINSKHNLHQLLQKIISYFDMILIYFDTKLHSQSFQVEVYKFAKRLIQNYNLKNVLDIGCGFGFKLKEFIYPICSDITGVDTKHPINFCKKHYHFGKWFVDNIENSSINLNKKFDLIISSDVIEHLIDPDRLLFYIKTYSHINTFIITSTPNRSRNSLHPVNRAHIREWNMSELYEYINSRGFKILRHFLVENYRKSGLMKIRKFFSRPSKTCQVIFAIPESREKI